MPTYSQANDFLTGDLPTPPYIDKNKVLSDAADEIDSYLGFLYQTPVDITETGATPRPVRLLLKRISTHLSSGRLIMAVATAQQNEESHAYGLYLVNEAVNTLKQIASGELLLEGVPANPLEPGEAPVATAPLISNLDAESNVEAFYNRIAKPVATWPHGTRPIGF